MFARVAGEPILAVAYARQAPVDVRGLLFVPFLRSQVLRRKNVVLMPNTSRADGQAVGSLAK